jgi:hypothetical protein
MHDGPVHDRSLALLPTAAERRAAVRLVNERRASERRSELQSLTASTVEDVESEQRCRHALGDA